jgi:hypothetical protein
VLSGDLFVSYGALHQSQCAARAARRTSRHGRRARPPHLYLSPINAVDPLTRTKEVQFVAVKITKVTRIESLASRARRAFIRTTELQGFAM